MTPTAVTVTAGQAVVSFTIPGPLDVETVQGVGLEQGSRAAGCGPSSSGPFPDEPVARSLQLDDVALRASASGLQPDLAFANTAPLDLSTDFLPFGETPKWGTPSTWPAPRRSASPG